MRRWIKNTRTVALCLIPIGLVAAFSNSWSNKIPISCVGSSGVKPFIETLSKDYMATNKKVDITVEAGGSGFGIQQVAQGFANIGNASKDPYKAVHGNAEGTDGFRAEWEKNRIKTITIGWEAICLVYIPPKDLKISQDDLNKILVVNQSNILNLMRIFTGIKDEHVNNPTLFDFYNPGFSLSEQQKQLLKNTSIKPYVRAGGSLTSGTASSFVGNTNLGFNESELTKEQQNAFDVGNYGTDYGLQQTDEANSRAWDMFAKNNNPGQIVYLSSGFVDQNLDLIKSKGYGIFSYGVTTTSYNVQSIDTPNGYNWFRPLNVMTSIPTDGKANPEMNFINAILSAAYHDTLAENGAKYLADDELEQIFPNLQFDNWISDCELAKKDDANWNWPDTYNFAPKPMGLE